MSKEKQPVSKVEWVKRSTLKANNYNPNKMPPPEFQLLKTSILENGWTQPIVVFKKTKEIVDGFHRWTVAGDKEVSALTDGHVPVVWLVQTKRDDRIMATIRHNRARGEHFVNQMANIVKELLESGVKPEDVCKRLGMEAEEVERLAEFAGLPDVVVRSDSKFSKGWIPGD